jgi:solute carrier family 25 (mitochondrial phosphate transporter), member 3
VSLASILHAMNLIDPEHPSTLGKLIVSMMAGALAGVLCGVVSHPADTVLSKLNQRGNSSVGGNTGAPLLASTIAAARNGSMSGHPGSASSGTLHDIIALVRDLGWRGVWKGLAPRLLMVSTLTALQWVAYDGFKVFVGLPTSGSVAHK